LSQAVCAPHFFTLILAGNVIFPSKKTACCRKLCRLIVGIIAAVVAPLESDVFNCAFLKRKVSVIVGLGLDIAEIDRIKAAIERHGAPLIERLFTPHEAAYCESHRDKFERYAGRFAAKEAAMKALGTGWRAGIRWRDIEVVREHGGKPTLELQGVARELANKMGVKNILLTITHSGNLALAEVIFENGVKSKI
jgi:holo-[acyl-carrier protein] synthase